MYLLLLHMPQGNMFITISETRVTRHHHPEPVVFRTVPHAVVHSVGVDKWIMTRPALNDHTESVSVPAPQILRALPIYPSLPEPLATASLFTVSIVLPFPEPSLFHTVIRVLFLRR